jgi:hypothetical protein
MPTRHVNASAKLVIPTAFLAVTPETIRLGIKSGLLRSTD